MTANTPSQQPSMARSAVAATSIFSWRVTAERRKYLAKPLCGGSSERISGA